jgi:AGCS family alanine or glycine:cation symporter
MIESIEAALFPIVCKINEYLSNYILVFLLLGIGFWYSIKTRFVQIRCFKEGWNSVFGNLSLRGKKHDSGMSSFQALATAIAAQVGTGNIVGASGAILTGGPGAIFWMWLIAFFGMATIYAEATLAQETRIVEKDGNVKGGPVYYITTAFKGGFGKFLAGFFAIAITLALGFFGCMVQSNSIGSTMQTAFGVPSWIVGLVLVAICGFIFLGGVQRLASVTEKVVPIMAAIFLLGGLIVLIARIKYVPATFGMIFKYAFAPQAIIGGGFGYAIKTAISQGAKRGLFSNEAGMGSTPHAHALANVKCPHDQGVVAMIGVFIDTFVVLTLNALVIISTLYTEGGPLHECGAAAASTTLGKANLAQTAFGVVFGETAGNMFVAVCLFFFAFSTILGWNLFGKINVAYLFGKKSVIVYTILALIFIFLGTMMANDLVWELSDMFNNLMVIPNVIALFALTNLVVKHANDPNRIPGKSDPFHPLLK